MEGERCVSLRGLWDKHHRLAGFNSIFSQFWRVGVQDQVGAQWVLLRPLSLPYRWLLSLVSSQAHPSVFVCVLIASHKDTSQIGLLPTTVASFQLNYPFKAESPTMVTI